MAEITKRGFETAWSLEGCQSGLAFVEAIDANGEVLGESKMTLIPDLRAAKEESDQKRAQKVGEEGKTEHAIHAMGITVADMCKRTVWSVHCFVQAVARLQASALAVWQV